MDRLCSIVVAVFSCSVSFGQLVTSDHVVDIGELDRRDERQIIIPVINQTGSDLTCLPMKTGGSVQAQISPSISDREMGELRLNFKFSDKKSIDEKVLVYTNYQDEPVEIRVKVKFRNGGSLDCPDFEKTSRSGKKARFRTVSSKKQQKPIVLWDKKRKEEDFTTSTQIKPCHVVILMDASSSMQTNGRLDLIKTLVKELVLGLRSIDAVSIIKYNQDQELVVKKMGVSRESKLLDTIEGIDPWGYTNGFEGIRSAVELSTETKEFMQSSHVLLCSDGAFNIGEDAEGIAQFLKIQSKVYDFRFSVISVGKNKHAEGLKMISEAGRGDFFQLKANGLNGKRVKKLLVQQLM